MEKFPENRMCNHSMENCVNSRTKIKWNGNSGKKSQKNLVYISPLLEIFLENTVLFCHWKFSEMESTLAIFSNAQFLVLHVFAIGQDVKLLCGLGNVIPKQEVITVCFRSKGTIECHNFFPLCNQF